MLAHLPHNEGYQALENHIDNKIGLLHAKLPTQIQHKENIDAVLTTGEITALRELKNDIKYFQAKAKKMRLTEDDIEDFKDGEPIEV